MNDRIETLKYHTRHGIHHTQRWRHRTVRNVKVAFYLLISLIHSFTYVRSILIICISLQTRTSLEHLCRFRNIYFNKWRRHFCVWFETLRKSIKMFCLSCLIFIILVNIQAKCTWKHNDTFFILVSMCSQYGLKSLINIHLTSIVQSPNIFRWRHHFDVMTNCLWINISFSKSNTKF